MRTEFHQRLDGLGADLAQMCGRASAIMQSATQVLLADEPADVDGIRAELKNLSTLGAAVHDRAYSLLALQAPVARDLRTVVSALQIAADADRMGALAAHVVRSARRPDLDWTVPDDVRGLLTQMGSTAVELAELARHAVETGDPSVAERICTGDGRMNDLHRELYRAVMARDWSHGPAVAAELALVGRFYERFADHAVEIARRVYFQVTGIHLEEITA